MPAYVTNRMLAMRKRRKSYSKNRNPYQRPVSKVPRFTLSQGGVPNGHLRSGPSLQSPEIKWIEVPSNDPSSQSWSYLQPATMLSSIIQGTSPNQRVGRQIRVVGFTYRLDVKAVENVVVSAIGIIPGNVNPVPQPFTMDIILDKQSSGLTSLPSIDANLSFPNGIYTGVGNTSLPNINSQDRYKFLKRIEVKNPTQESHIVSGLIKCNFLVNYDASTGFLANLTSNNLLVTFACAGATNPTISGVFRVVYTDV